jgi:hypothetical protein
MVVTVKYKWNKNEITFKAFSNEVSAFKFMDKIANDTSYSEVAPLVDYSNVAIYKEKFELLFQRLLDQADNVANVNVKSKIEKEEPTKKTF